MATLKIGSATALLSTDEPRTTPDDRMELVKGVYYDTGTASFKPTAVAVGLGRCAAGDVTSYSGVKFRAADWTLVEGYWAAQTLVTVIGVDGVSLTNCRVRITGYAPHRRFSGTVTADIDIWRV